MRRPITIAVLAALSLMSAFPALSQVVSRSRQVPGFRPYDIDLAVMSRAEKDSIRMVADIWKMYVESFTSASVSEDLRRSMWMDGAQDYLLEFDDGAMLYSSFRENRIIDVRKLDSGIYELVGMTSSKLAGEENSGWIEGIYRVCAMAVAASGDSDERTNPFRLGNWLDAVVSGIEKTTVGCIDYYCTPGCSIALDDVAGTAGFASAFAETYEISLEDNLRYVVAPSEDHCEQMSGFIFNAYSNPLMGTVASKTSGYGFYGRTFGSRTLLSNYFDDHYDVALLLARKGFPRALPMLQAGIAAYYGGCMTFSYSDLKAALKDYLSTDSTTNLSDEDSFYDTAIPVMVEGSPAPVVMPLEGILGAVRVEHALKAGGTVKVKEVLRSIDYNSIFNKFGVDPENIDQFVRGLL